MTRVIKIQLTEEEDSGISEVLLDNSDLALTTLYTATPSVNFEEYQCIIYFGYFTGVARSIWVKNSAYAVGDVVTPTTLTGYQYRCTIAGTSHATTEPTWGTALGVTQTDGSVTWEMDGNTGDEYAPRAPLKVEAQEFQSSETQLTCRLYLIGIPNDLAGDEAEGPAYTQESGDTNTVKALLDAIAAPTLTPYTNYPAVTLTYDTGYDDSIINAFKPAEYFSVSVNNTRDDKISELLAYTHCRRRAEADGAIHIFQPTLTGTTYDYEYQLATDTYHTFFSKALRHRFVKPNKEIVSSHPSQGSYTGSATSATSYALRKKIRTTYRRLASSAQAALIAAAIIERSELAAERGSAVVPMNCGQELFDYVKITDARENSDYRVGNVQYIQFNCSLGMGNSEGRFDMTIRFGKLNLQSISALLGDAEAGGGGGVSQQVIDTINTMLDDITALFKNQLTMLTEGFRIDQTLFYGTGYDPSGKRRTFTATPTTPYDVGDLWADGTVLKRCTTARASGAYVAGDWTQLTVDEIANGSTYVRVLATDISAGHILLSSNTVVSGEWYDESGVEIDAASGINIYGTANALTTRATKTGTIQCYVGADGMIYAGAGAIWLSATELGISGPALHVYSGAVHVGTLSGTALGAWLIAPDDAAGYRDLNLVSTLGDIYIDAAGDIIMSGAKVTQAQPTRALDTIYQNTGGKIREVTVYCTCQVLSGADVLIQGGSYFYAVCSSYTPPDTKVGQGGFFISFGEDNNYARNVVSHHSITFKVPPNYYYKVITATSDEGVAPALNTWTEWDLF